MRPAYWTILALVVLALAVWALLRWSGGARQATPSPQAAQVAQDLRQKPYTEHGDTYDISASYPTTTPLGEAPALTMQGWVIGEISAFKDRAASSAHASLTITFEASSTATAASYVFTESADGVVSTRAFIFATTTHP